MEKNDFEKEYEQHLFTFTGIRSTVLSLLSGFTFSAIGSFLNQFQNKNNLITQTTLLVLSLIFYLFLFLLAWQYLMVIGITQKGLSFSHIKSLRERMKIQGYFHILVFLGFSLWGYTIVLMFMLWDLSKLAIITGVIWTFNILILTIIMRRTISKLRSQAELYTNTMG